MAVVFLILCTSLLSHSVAEAQVGVAVGGHAGYAAYSADTLTNDGLCFGLNANISIMPVFSAQIFGDYFKHTESGEGPGPVVETEYTDIPIGLHLMYAINIPGVPVKPYLGAGPSIHMIKWKQTGVAQATDESSTKFGIGGVAGAEIGVAPKLGIFLELRDHYIFTEEQNTNALYVFGGLNLHLI